MTIFDVEELWTHGGSLRIYARHAADASRPPTARVLRAAPARGGCRLPRARDLHALRGAVRETKRKLLELLIELKRAGKTIVGYGAPGKGNTLLNYCGIRTDFLDFTVDRNPYKQGRFLPGTHIPIFAPERIDETKPDYIFILPWNFKDEILAQLARPRMGRAVHRADPRAGRHLGRLGTARHFRIGRTLSSVTSAVLGSLSAARTIAATSARLEQVGGPVVLALRVVDGGLHRAGSAPKVDAENVDASVVDFLVQAVGERPQRVLGRRIRPDAPTRREPGARVYEYDLTSAAAEGRQQGLRQQVRGPDVGAILRV